MNDAKQRELYETKIYHKKRTLRKGIKEINPLLTKSGQKEKYVREEDIFGSITELLIITVKFK